jgi:hypothetical protein
MVLDVMACNESCKRACNGMVLDVIEHVQVMHVMHRVIDVITDQ